MAKQVDPKIAEVLQKFGFGRDAAWDCHGTWVVYHRVLEQIAAKAGIRFDMPVTLEANGAAKTVAICVTGTLGEKAEWSIGESSPANNKNAYPYAMAEKRAKDRVVLKLIGLHGLAYCEDEADDFKAPPEAPVPVQDTAPEVSADPPFDPEACFTRIKEGIEQVVNGKALDTFLRGEKPNIELLSPEKFDALKSLASKRRDELERKAA